MQVVNKKTNLLSREETSDLFDVCYNNLPNTVLNSKNYSELSTSNYKEEWINEIINEENGICLIYSNGERFVGFVIIYLRESENFIREFQILKEFQDDGKTFYEMIKLALPFTDTSKIYTGIIYEENRSAIKSFKNLGVGIIKGKYQIKYDLLKKMLDKKLTNNYYL